MPSVTDHLRAPGPGLIPDWMTACLQIRVLADGAHSTPLLLIGRAAIRWLSGPVGQSAIDGCLCTALCNALPHARPSNSVQ